VWFTNAIHPPLVEVGVFLQENDKLRISLHREAIFSLLEKGKLHEQKTLLLSGYLEDYCSKN